MKLRNNIFKMYLLKGFSWFMVAMPIIVLFFQENGLSLMQVMILQSVYSITLGITEIPSGYLADSFGRRKSIIYSTIFTFCGYLIFCYFNEFNMYLVAQIFAGIGGSLISGTDTALIYDTLIEEKDEKEYNKIEGKTYAIGNFSESIAGVIGGILATSSLLLPIQVQTCILFFTIPVAFSLVEPTINQNNKIEKKFLTILLIVKHSLSENLKLKWLIIYSSIMGVATLSVAWLAQPFFQSIEIPIFYYGILWGILNITAGISSYSSYKYDNKYNIINILTVLSILISISFIMIYFSPNYFGLIFIFLIYYVRGIVTPLLKKQININTKSNIRATVMSVRSFILRVSFAIIAPILGYFGDKGINNSFLLLSILITIFISISTIKLKQVFLLEKNI